jgi:hypothetical protein
MEVADKFVLQFLVDTKKAKKDIKAIPTLLTTTAKKNNSVFNKTFKSVNKNTSQFFKTFNTGLKEVNTNFNILTKSFSDFNPLKSLSGKSLGSILGIGGVIGGSIIAGEELVRKFSNEGARVKFLSQNLRTSAKDLQIYEQSIVRMGGSVEEADSSLLTLDKRLTAMRKGSDPNLGNSLSRYGMHVDDKMTALDVKKMILERIGREKNVQTQKTIQMLTGITDSELLLGQKSPQEQQQLFNDVGQKGILSKEQTEEAVKMKNYFDGLFQSIKMVAYEVGEHLIPAFKGLGDILVPTIKAMGKIIDLFTSLFDLVKSMISSALENKQVKDVLKVAKDTKHAVEKQIGFRIVTNPIEAIEGLTYYAKKGADYLKGKSTPIKKPIKAEQTSNSNDFDSVPPIMQNGKLINQQDYEQGKRQLIKPRSLSDEHAQLLNSPNNRPTIPNTSTNIQIGSISLPNVTKPHEFTQESLKNALMVNGFNTGRLA